MDLNFRDYNGVVNQTGYVYLRTFYHHKFSILYM